MGTPAREMSLSAIRLPLSLPEGAPSTVVLTYQAPLCFERVSFERQCFGDATSQLAEEPWNS